MHEIFRKIEHYNAKLIPWAIIILFFIILIDFLHVENALLLSIIHILDYVIIAIFVIDLIFLAIHSKNARFFFKNYWLDILAVFPFMTFSRLVSLFSSEAFLTTQLITHESIEVSRNASRLEKLSKSFKTGTRIVRVLSKSRKLKIGERKTSSKRSKKKKR